MRVRHEFQWRVWQGVQHRQWSTRWSFLLTAPDNTSPLHRPANTFAMAGRMGVDFVDIFNEVPKHMFNFGIINARIVTIRSDEMPVAAENMPDREQFFRRVIRILNAYVLDAVTSDTCANCYGLPFRRNGATNFKHRMTEP